ncbi:MAG: hypothetical protein RIC80_07125 [Cyclobacteriaceae bacterium]
MKIVEPKIEILLDKLTLSAELYRKAAERVHNKMMQEQFGLQAERKATYIDQLAYHLNLNLEDHQAGMVDRLKLQLEKLGIEIDHVYLRQNAKEVLSFCLNREEELINAYRGVLQNSRFDNHVKLTLKSQVDDSIRLKNELKALHEEYDIQDA